MFLIILAYVGYVYLLMRVFFHGFRVGDLRTTLIMLAVLFVVLLYLTARRLNRPAKQAQKIVRTRQTAVPAPLSRDSSVQQPEVEHHFVSFKVAGVTFKNSDGSNRQTILRHLKFGDKPYVDDSGALVMSITESEYDGELAYEVRINDYQIGYVPKDKIQDVSVAVSNDCEITGVRISGGGYDDEDNKIPFGCSVTLRY